MMRRRDMAETKELKLAGPKVLLEGPSGTGKTFSIGTLVDWCSRHEGFEVYCIYTENSLETLLGYWLDRDLEVPKCLHWHECLIPSLDLDSLQRAAKDAGMLSYEQLSKLVDLNRSKNNPWEKFLRVFADVPDDRTGKTSGNVGTWDARRILVVDSLSEAANACFRMQTGNKPTASPPEYMVAQNNLLGWVRFMTQSLRCGFIMTAHVQRQVNEVTGTTQLMTKAIGKALADDIPPLFSEVLYCKREVTSWYWDTAAVGVDTKTRYLPIEGKIRPDFAQIWDKWLKRASV